MVRLRVAVILLSSVFSIVMQGQEYFVVADYLTHSPLPGASISDSNGNAVGICNSKGRAPYIPLSCYPITVRYLGYHEMTVVSASSDTIFLRESFTELPEVVIESREQKVLHMLAYVREYSTLSTYTDTVFLFREKMVDYMPVPDRKIKFKGWRTPRMLKSRSYYCFTDSEGLDSVSDVGNNHFSWSDWIGVNRPISMPPSLVKADCGSDTVYGRYGRAEIWTKNRDKVKVSVDVLADSVSHRWAPYLTRFFGNDTDFDNFRMQFNFDNVAGASVSPDDLTGYSFTVESRGRGHEMFRFNRSDEPFFVTTYAEVYILDKEYITVKEARQWEKHRFDDDDLAIIEPAGAPELQPSVLMLIDRVENIDRDMVRLDFVPDHNLGCGRLSVRQLSFGQRLLSLLKNLTGISSYKSNKKQKENWRRFTRDWKKKRRGDKQK